MLYYNCRKTVWREVEMEYLINRILEQELEMHTEEESSILAEQLINRLETEFGRQDKSGIYGLTQYQMAYNSNRIEGSRLTENQTISLFETGTVYASAETFRAKDIEEATGHFLMFNEMIKTYHEPLTEELIKAYHFRLKSGVFEDMANGYPVGEYKNRTNRVGQVLTTPPEEVPERMKELLFRYHEKKQVTLSDLAEFHLQYERIHPFQDGNGRTGRMILYKECLKHRVLPFIIRDENKAEYYAALQSRDPELLCGFFKKEQKDYYETVREFLHIYEKKQERKPTPGKCL